MCEFVCSCVCVYFCVFVYVFVCMYMYVYVCGVFTGVLELKVCSSGKRGGKGAIHSTPFCYPTHQQTLPLSLTTIQTQVLCLSLHTILSHKMNENNKRGKAHCPNTHQTKGTAFLFPVWSLPSLTTKALGAISGQVC